MKDIIRATFVLGFATFISLAVNVVKRKVMAVYLGPAGLGIFSQVFNYFNVATIIASFGLSQGITTFIAKGNNLAADRGEINAILKSAMSILLFISLIIILGTFLFLKDIAALVLNNRTMNYLLIFAAVGIPFQILGQALLSYLQGVKRIKSISLANIFISIFGLICTIPLIVYFNIVGAAISVFLLALITFIVYVYFCKDNLEARTYFGIFNFFRIARSNYFLKLINFGSLRFIQIALSWATFFIMRIIIIRKLGAASNGMYEAVYTFSLLYLPFISNLLWSYSYPEYCQARDNKALASAVNKFLRLSLTVVFPIIVILVLAGPILVEKIIFTTQFSPAIKLMPLRFLVDILTVVIWSFNVVLLAKDRLKVAVKFELIKDILFLAAVYLTTSYYQLPGLLLIDALCSLLLILFSYAYIKRYFDFKLLDRNRALIVSSLSLFVIISLLPSRNIFSFLLGISILVIWITKFVSLAEFRRALSSLRLNGAFK